MFKKVFILLLFILIYEGAGSQILRKESTFTRQDTLRGSIGKGRSWWDVKKYDINVEVNIPEKFIRGFVDITFTTQKINTGIMQIDLQEPMQIEKIENLSVNKQSINFTREGNVFWLD
ncbi:MAG TPA: M1 family peptidase, partial [Niabella sp.]|nr:M1 family peptidase [Niabella sp.]